MPSKIPAGSCLRLGIDIYLVEHFLPDIKNVGGKGED